MSSLLAVDLGLRTGLALYGEDGRLSWYRSKNYGSAARLRRDIHNILNSIPDMALLVIEGGGTLAAIWQREAERRGIPVRQITAEMWRQKLLYPREQLTGLQAKHNADELARKIILWSGMSLPSALRHDTAEAILIGYWALVESGWITKTPRELRSGRSV